MDPAESVGSRASEEEEPLIPEEIDDEFYNDLLTKIGDLIRYTRNKLDNQVNADNIQRMQMVSEKFKCDLLAEKKVVEELNEIIQKLQEELEQATAKSLLDKSTNDELKSVIQNAWKQRDAALVRDEQSQDEMFKLREKIEHLETVLQRTGEKDKRGSTEIDKLRDNFNKEIEKLKNEIKDTNKKLQIARQYIIEVEAIVHRLEDKNKNLIQILDENSSESFQDKKKLEKLKAETEQAKIEQEKCEEKMRRLKIQNEKYLKQHVQNSLQIFAIKSTLDQSKTLHNATNNKLIKALTDLEQAVTDNERLKMELARDKDNRRLKLDNRKYFKIADGVTRKLTASKRSKIKVESEVKRLIIQQFTLEKELKGEQKVVETFDTKVGNLTRERDNLKRELLAKIKKLNEIIRDLEMQINKHKEEVKKSQSETTKKQEEIEVLLKKIDRLDIEVRFRNNIIEDLNRDIAKEKEEIKKLIEEVKMAHNETSNIQRNYERANIERDKLKNEVDNIKDQGLELKDAVTKKAAEISRLSIQVERLEKDRICYKGETRNMQILYQHTKCELLDKKKENDKLQKTIAQKDQKIKKIELHINNVLHEKNSVCGNLNKANEEIEALKDRLGLTRDALEHCERSYNESMDNIRLLRMEVKNLRAEREVLKKDRENSADLRTELLQIHRVLNQERIKARALEDEITRPMNVHRWRALSGKDPDKMELIFKIQTLQKQILAQNIVTIQRENALSESHKLYTTLKNFMMRLPSHKLKEKVIDLSKHLGAKNNKIKALAAEIATKEIDDKAKDTALEDLRAKLTSAKKELLDQKKSKRKLLEERQMFAEMQLQCFSAPPAAPRILGAGYKMTFGSPIIN
ncbi:cilia- and flagella-associated protein 58 [Condylostylus longicornis]|uniref:cilia- and flagella-associated protein 58 n=1 Tax=Condylostylus longicornis TaxID=2530218 RepID=UPI00244E2D4D|nr:cilia- and flagella-associated protein 58 [Condylostylus longicornis]